MPKSYADLLREARAQIREVTTAGGRRARRPAARRSSTSARRPSGSRATCPAPPTSPRATSSSRSRRAVPDRDAPVVLYCAGGVRSLFAAQTLAEMGYTERRVDVGRVPGAGRARASSSTRPVVLTRRAEAALQPPPADPRGRLGRPGEAPRLEGAVHRRGRARVAGARSTSPRRASGPSASSTSTSSTSATSSARSSTRPTGSASARSSPPRIADQRPQPRDQGRRPRGDAGRARTSSGSSPATT